MRVDQLAQGGVELLLAAVDHVHLAQVGGEAEPVKLRPGRECAANVPGIGGAADRPVNDVQGVGDGIEHHARAAEDAGALAHRPGRRSAFAVELQGLLRPCGRLAALALSSDTLPSVSPRLLRAASTCTVRSFLPALAVLAIHQHAEYLLQQPHGAPVAHRGKYEWPTRSRIGKPWRTKGMFSSRAMYLP